MVTSKSKTNRKMRNLRKKKIERIKSMRGKLKFDMTADEIRHCERDIKKW
jgi:hypothetical protein